MKWILFLLSLLLTNNAFARQSIMHSLYLADRPDFGDDEFSMVGEFGFLLANGNTNASTITARINTSQELTTWSYQVIADTLYKQSEREVDGAKRKLSSAQKIFLSGQYDYKLDDPSNRLFVYGEYDDNRFSGYRYQAAIAAGWSSRLWHDEQSELKYSVGPGYAISEAKQDVESNDFEGLIVRAAMEYKRKFSGNATFRQFISTEAEQDFSKTKSETSLSTKLTGALAMKLSFAMDLDTSIGEDIEDLNTETAVTLVYQFF